MGPRHGAREWQPSTLPAASVKCGHPVPFRGLKDQPLAAAHSMRSLGRGEAAPEAVPVAPGNPREQQGHQVGISRLKRPLSPASAPSSASVFRARGFTGPAGCGVILILTKYYHADAEKVLESSLWRSSDFGTTYTKLAIQPGFTTVIDSFFICPANKRKILFLSSSLSSGEQNLFLSMDEATTFQKQLVPFTVDKLIFHPKDEDKVLAYTKEGQLYASCDLGRKWLLLHEQVTKDHVFWAESGVGAGPDLVHMEQQLLLGQESRVATPLLGSRGKLCPGWRRWLIVSAAPQAGAGLGNGHGGCYSTDMGKCRIRFVTAHVRNCSSRTLSSLFAGPIDHRSLLLQDEYIFFKATSSNQTRYYVSYRHNEFALMKLPKYALPKDLQVISTDESQVLVAVQEWYQTDTYNLYQSDPRGVFYSLVLEDVRSSRQAEAGVIVDVLEVGRWPCLALPTPPLPDCHLHLHLLWADNPYVSGTVHTKETAPGLIMGAGNLGSQLVEYKEEMYITSDCGRTWRQVRRQGGAAPTPCSCCDPSFPVGGWTHSSRRLGVVAKQMWMPLGAGRWLLLASQERAKPGVQLGPGCWAGPGGTWLPPRWSSGRLSWWRWSPGTGRAGPGGQRSWAREGPCCPRTLALPVRRFSTDEGLTWSTYNFTDTSVFVDGLLSEPGEETLVITIFGHISYRSEWELVKVDFRPSFPRPCRAEDYSAWDLTNLQGDGCLMGQRRSFRRRKAMSWCVNGRNFTSALTARVCPCQDSDFLCDYGFERSLSDTNKCFANFWFNPLAPPDDCVQGQTYTSSLGYRKVVANLCQGGVDPSQNPVSELGVHTSASGFLQGDVLTTKYQVDLGDGSTPVPVNLTLRRERVRHRYESPGIYRVSVRAENVAGRDEAVLFVQVNPPLQALYLEVVPVVGINEEVNLTAVLLPLNPNLTVFYWWIGLSLQPLLSLNNSVATRFVDTGDVRVTVQASCGSSVLQASKVVRVLDQFQVVPLQFSRNLDTYNPNTPEWREDVGQVVSWLLAKETAIPAELLVTVIEPGLPTVAASVLVPSRSHRRSHGLPHAPRGRTLWAHVASQVTSKVTVWGNPQLLTTH
ncbi:PREDICTED: VPS10 domain-containing receptor SorCS2 [Myotis davidii]|uniref:VPS10 domain-containing receptor SorCS2 n=1 Tax=Myotis davidii TaxID=225400 RepID=UPI0007672700|nr:PREDICTED: VPS10 domain-containing receptor SorCS2 [Myotis davidii]